VFAAGAGLWRLPYDNAMSFIRILLAPILRVMKFPVLQLMAAIAAILLLQAADSRSLWGQMFDALDRVVALTIGLCGEIFEVKSFTRSWLTFGLMIAYVYIAGLVLVSVARFIVRTAVELAARSNVFGLTNAIARERGIAAYRAWLPLERIRPAHIPQEKWEERFAWPADGKPPYPPFTHRVLRAMLAYASVLLLILVLLQAFTPFPALSWLGKGARMLLLGN
jgi:hypothetical protein